LKFGGGVPEMPAAPSPTDWLAELGNEQSEAARTRRPRRRRARAPPPRSYLSMMAKDARSIEGDAAAQRSAAERVGSIVLAPVAAPRRRRRRPRTPADLKHVKYLLGEQAGGFSAKDLRLVSAFMPNTSEDGATARSPMPTRSPPKRTSGFPSPVSKKSPTASQKRAASLVDDLGNDGKMSREEARELRELLNPNAPVDSPGAAEAKRRAAAERAMRLQFVQGIKKRGMTDFEASMIQESRKGGRSPGRRR